MNSNEDIILVKQNWSADGSHFSLQRTWGPKPQDLLAIDLSNMLSLHSVPAPLACSQWKNNDKHIKQC